MTPFDLLLWGLAFAVVLFVNAMIVVGVVKALRKDDEHDDDA